MSEHKKLKEGIKVLQEKLEKQEVYWRNWNGRAANRNAKLEGEIKEIRSISTRLLTLATKYCPKEHHDWDEILEISKKL